MGRSRVELQTARISSFLSLLPAGDIWWARVSVMVVGLPDSGGAYGSACGGAYGRASGSACVRRDLHFRCLLAVAPVYRCGFLAVSLVPLFSHTLNKVNGFLVVSYGVVDPACLAERQLDIRPALSPAVCLRRVSYFAVRSLYMKFRFNECNSHGGVDWRRQSSGHFFE
ncbi:hypothetical protein DY000_02026145 [Brassica cretica]|uniref:Uncharacterized protein n=1 Tax=Brassica cretica TaxID=69181 RepID=A0ABQ7EG05_BRACR|nr:hypothetical protein DY000_02026145 [Brassica cretica]